MEILYSPVIPVCIIRRSKEPFWVTLKISIGTAFSFSVSLAETTRKMCWKFNDKTVTLPWKYSTLLNYMMYNTYYITKQVFNYSSLLYYVRIVKFIEAAMLSIFFLTDKKSPFDLLLDKKKFYYNNYTHTNRQMA